MTISRRSVLRHAVLLLTLLGLSRQLAGQAYTVLHYLATDGSEGNLVWAPLVEGSDLSFYGICTGGGTHSLGTAFKITPGGTFTKLHDFTGVADGGSPLSFIRGNDGNFYGLTMGAQINPTTYYPGTFFKMTPAGIVTTLHYFMMDQSEGLLGPAFLSLASDGNFYGTSAHGGLNSYGTFFQITPGGVLTKLHDFGPYADPGGIGPNGFVEANDHNFYGTTLGGGANNIGTIFRITKTGTYGVLHSFAFSDGDDPGAGQVAPSPIQASDGNIWGTTTQEGAGGVGTVWKMTLAGVFTVVYAPAFVRSEGENLYTGLLQANDGALYGSATGGGLGSGTLYQVTLPGSWTDFHKFDFGGANGSGSFFAPIQGSDGNLYGPSGGTNLGVGAIYKHVLPPSVLGISPTSGVALPAGEQTSSGPAVGGTAVVVTGTTFATGAAVTIGGAAATGVSVVDATHIDATTPSLPPGTLNDVTVTNANGGLGTLQNGWFADFLDVPQGDIFHPYVEKVFRHGITAGCGGGNYCRNNAVRRDQMAVFLLKAEHGSSYVPPACTGIFADVPCPGTFTNWIEQLAAEAITGGCGGNNYCPGNPVTRQQMAVFLLKTEHGSSYVPPACTGIFADVPCPSTFANWIEQLYHENVTGGCSTSPLRYCPTSSNTRGQMAVFITKTFNLQ